MTRDEILARLQALHPDCTVEYDRIGQQYALRTAAGEPWDATEFSEGSETAGLLRDLGYSIEVRMGKMRDGSEEFDEVVARQCLVHLEKMDADEFALLIYTPTETMCVRIFAKPLHGRAAEIDAEISWRESEPRLGPGETTGPR